MAQKTQTSWQALTPEQRDAAILAALRAPVGRYVQAYIEARLRAARVARKPKTKNQKPAKRR